MTFGHNTKKAMQSSIAFHLLQREKTEPCKFLPRILDFFARLRLDGMQVDAVCELRERRRASR